MPRFDRCVMILVDGARADVFERLMDAGELPACKELFADRGGFRSGTTAMPSVSGPAHLPPLTGCYPGRCNIPGIRWFDRRRYSRGVLEPLRFRSYMGPRKRENMNREVSADVPSVWEVFPDGAAVGCWFTRGLDRRGDLTRGTKTRAWLKGLLTRRWEAGDAAAAGALLSAVRGSHPFVFAVFPTIDELGHKGGPESDASVEAYRTFDRFLPRLRDALVASGGDADRTLLMVTSDHGLSATHTHFDLAGFVRRHVPRLLDFPFVFRHLVDCDAAAMVSGNALAHLSFRGPGGWEDLPDVTRPGSPAATVVEALLAEPAVDLVVHREGDAIRVRSRAGSALVRREGEHIRYSPDGADPMGLPELPAVMTDGDARRLTAGTPHPDGLVQWEQLFWSERCGDVVVAAAPGWDLRAHFEYQDHKGSHGSTFREHMRVPVLASTPLPEHPRTADLLPTALGALGRVVRRRMDGRDLAEAASPGG